MPAGGLGVRPMPEWEETVYTAYDVIATITLGRYRFGVWKHNEEAAEEFAEAMEDAA